jgi:hypothetical protein
VGRYGGGCRCRVGDVDTLNAARKQRVVSSTARLDWSSGLRK